MNRCVQGLMYSQVGVLNARPELVPYFEEQAAIYEFEAQCSCEWSNQQAFHDVESILKAEARKPWLAHETKIVPPACFY